MTRPAVVLVNLGTPEAPTPADVRRYLRQFLSDRRVVDLHPALWRPILELAVLPVRGRASARIYRKVWTEDGSPLLVHSQRQAAALREELAGLADVHVGMTYGRPSVGEVLSALATEPERPIVVVPMYPQYSGSTTGAVVDAVRHWVSSQAHCPELTIMRSFPTDAGYVGAVASAIRDHWDRVGEPDTAAGDRLVLSYHGIPVSMVEAGDTYDRECAATTAAVVAELGIDPAGVLQTFQSKFGPSQWLTPATIDTMGRLGREGTRRVDVVCPGFVSDCLETLEEIEMLNCEEFLGAGGEEFHYVPWGNAERHWVRALAALAASRLPRPTEGLGEIGSRRDLAASSR